MTTDHTTPQPVSQEAPQQHASAATAATTAQPTSSAAPNQSAYASPSATGATNTPYATPPQGNPQAAQQPTPGAVPSGPTPTAGGPIPPLAQAGAGQPQDREKKPGAKFWGIVVAVSLVCGLLGGLGGGAIANAVSGGHEGPVNGHQMQMPGGSGDGPSDGSGMGEPPSGGMGGHGGPSGSGSSSDSGSSSQSGQSSQSSYETDASTDDLTM